MKNYWDIEELALEMSGLPEEEFDFTAWVWDNYHTGTEQFCEIVNDLLEYTPVLESPLTGKKSHCFGIIINPETGLFQAIVKEELEND